MRTYIVVHHHRHGHDVYLFKTDRKDSDFPSDYVIAQSLNIDLEPDREDDWIDIHQTDLTNIKTI